MTPKPRSETNHSSDASAPREQVPAPTPVSLSIDELFERGVSGGYTRAAWDGAVAHYGDLITQTNAGAAEPRIEVVLPRSSRPIRLALIEYRITVITSAGTKLTKVHEKPIFEDKEDLGELQTHARPYMSAVIDGLKHAPPLNGAIVTVKVPVSTSDGSDAVIELQFPWRSHDGALELRTWWIAKSAFAKGSPFNP